MDEASGDGPGWELLRQHVRDGFAAWLTPDEAEQVAHLQLNPMALLEQLKADGSLKHRIIHDLKAPGTNRCQRVPERVVYPRVTDALDDYSDLLEHVPRAARVLDDFGRVRAG